MKKSGLRIYARLMTGLSVEMKWTGVSIQSTLSSSVLFLRGGETTLKHKEGAGRWRGD